MPARSGGSSGVRSTRTRTGMRCTTFTQLPRGVLRRQHRELGAAGGRDALHDALPGAAGIGVDGDLDRIAGLDLGEFGLLRVGLHPDALGGDQAERRRRRR